MEVYRRNGKLVVLFNSTKSSETKIKKHFGNHLHKDPEFKDDTFRKWQENLVRTISEKANRSSESINEILNQILIRRKMNRDLEKQSGL